jgi:protein-disulfide isomerase/rhodanese-related sulfurtransferase
MRKTLAFISVLVGLFASTYLTWAYTSSSHRMVCMGGGCDTVRASKYAHLWGLPLPIYGLAFYIWLAVMILVESRLPEYSRRIWRLILIISAGGVLFSGWLTGLEAFVIHAWCEWCVTQAIAIAVTFLLTLTIVLTPGETSPPSAEGSGTRQFRARLAVLMVAIVVGAPALWWVIRHENKQSEQQPPVAVVTGAAKLIRADSHEAGPANAPLTIVEFGDFQCPSCGVAEKTNRAIREQYGNKVRFVFRQFPLETIHQFAFQAAKASECAGQQGKFWPMVETLYDDQADLTAPSLKKYAAEQGLDVAKFDACLEDPAVSARIREDIADGTALGVRATPTFFLNGKKIEGGLTFMDVEAALSAAKKAQSVAQTAPPTEKPPSAAPGTKAAPTMKLGTTSAPNGREQGKDPAAAKGEKVQPNSGNPIGINIAAKGGLNPLAAQTQSSPFVPCGIEDAPVQDPPMIHVAEMKKLLDDKSAIFVDVRGRGAFKEAHIPTAVNATIDQLQKKIPPELSKSKLIVFYEAGGADDSCTTSKTAGRILMQNGFKEVKVFKEGLEGWKKEGLPIAQ